MSLFKRAALPKSRVTVSPTFRAYRPTMSSFSGLVARRDLDPNTSIHDEGKFTDEPDVKLERLSWTDNQFSFATWVKTRAGSLPWYIKLRKPNGAEVKNADRLVKQLIALLDGSVADSSGYHDRMSLDILIDQAFRSSVVHGAIAGELCLNRRMKPKSISLIPPHQVHWEEISPGVYKPFQTFSDGGAQKQTLYDGYQSQVSRLFSGSVGAHRVDLDIPTFFFSRLDPSLMEPHNISPNLPVLNMIFAKRQFLNDMQMVVRKLAWPRISARLVEEKIKASMPDHVRHGEPSVQQAYVQSRMDELSNVLQHMQPGHVLVHADYFDVGVLESKSHAQGTLNADPLLSVMHRETAQSSKTYDAVLGGSVAPSPLQVYIESMSLKGYQKCVSEFLSKAFTMMLRIQGKNYLASFHFAEFEMRPQSELEPSRTMRISNDLKLLSLGVMTPEEFSIRNTGTPLPDGSYVQKLFNNKHAADSLLQIHTEKKMESSDTDSPLSPGVRRTEDGDGRSKPEASVKRGQTPSAKRSGTIKKSPTGETRTPRVK